MTDQRESMSPNDDFDRLVGQNIADLRKARGWTQEALAQAANALGILPSPLRQQTIVKIEKGTRPLRLREAEALAVALDAAVDDLLINPGPTFDRALLLIRATERADVCAVAVTGAAEDLMQAMGDVRFALKSAGKDKGISQQLLDAAFTTTQYDPIKLARLGMEKWDSRLRERSVVHDAAPVYAHYERDNG